MEKINLTYLNEMSAGDHNLLTEMIEIYNSQVPEFINEMEKYYNDKNWEQLSATAHKAKSSVAIVGLNNLANDLKTLELDAKKEINTENYINIITKFKQTTLESINELNKHIQNLQRS